MGLSGIPVCHLMGLGINGTSYIIAILVLRFEPIDSTIKKKKKKKKKKTDKL